MSDATPPAGHLFLGGVVDPATHERSGEPVHLEAADLTTHGVIVGMTGSGKTGLGIVLLEEALLAGIPVLALDPKGDLGNLLLTFPGLTAQEFRPWIDEAEAGREGRTPDEHAAAVATTWREGLAGWGVDPARIAALRAAAEFTILTPGSDDGVPLDLVGTLAPPADLSGAAEQAADTTAGLLRLVGVDSDPLTGREHILLTNLIDRAWRAGTVLDLPGLIAQVQEPPLRKLGVIELETFFPAPARLQLALRLNALLASPTFAAWMRGEPLDIDAWLGGSGRCTIVNLAHLSDDERQFVVTLLMSRLVSWFRTQAGTSSLRALVYVDEVMGYVPPVAAPPSKAPILTTLKQARAFGVGLVLATQNPVDLDYKALSNAGTWMVGRLQTERDKDRLLEGLRSASGAADIDAAAATISGLAKREFLLHQAGGGVPQVFSSRWAMSYLRGPLTGPQIATLMAGRTVTAVEEPVAGPAAGPVAAQPVAPAPPGVDLAPDLAQPAPSSRLGQLAPPPVPRPPEGGLGLLPAPPPEPGALPADQTPIAPKVADGVAVRWLDPAAAWAATVGATPGGTRLVAGVAARVTVRYDDAALGLDHTEEYEAVVVPLSGQLDAAQAITVDYDDRDLRNAAPAGAVYVLPDAPIHTKTWFTSAGAALKRHLEASRSVTVLRNRPLKLASRPGEAGDAFAGRCRDAAGLAADAEAAKLRERLERQADRLHDVLERGEQRLGELEVDVKQRRNAEWLSGAGGLLGSLLGGRRTVRGMAGEVRRASDRRSQSARTAQRLETAEERVADARQELVDLEAELADELAEIDGRWNAAALDIEEVAVTPDKGDVDVVEVVLVWVPRAG